MPDYTIGPDLGGANLRAAISSEGQLLLLVTGHTQYAEGREAFMNDMVDAISLREGVVRNCNNIPSLENFPMRDQLSQRLSAPVILENDANGADLAEQWTGAGRGLRDVVLLTLGTGAGGIIGDGKIIRGFIGMAGERGHVTVVPNGNPCGCGNRGCLEKHA